MKEKYLSGGCIMEKLNPGVAYHGNRMFGHVRDDMLDIVNHNMNLVVHMFTHNDMKRHKNVMKDNGSDKL